MYHPRLPDSCSEKSIYYCRQPIGTGWDKELLALELGELQDAFDFNWDAH